MFVFLKSFFIKRLCLVLVYILKLQNIAIFVSANHKLVFHLEPVSLFVSTENVINFCVGGYYVSSKADIFLVARLAAFK